MRQLTYAQAIREATDQCMEKDPSIFVIGEGVPDPKGVFGTTIGLQEKYGPARVMDMPVSENGMTGVCIGAALRGMRPILVHARVDFSLYSFDQIVNAAAKWFYMFGGQTPIPLVIRMIIGRGWGQGSQHSQNLQATFGHIPGLKVVMPAAAYDAKGLLIAAIQDNNPVVFIEHRWLHGVIGDVPEKMYRVPIGKANVVTKGRDITIISTSFMTVESLHAAEILKQSGVSAEVVDLRSIKPLDTETILGSAKKTRRLIVADTGHRSYGVAAEIIARVCESKESRIKNQESWNIKLKAPPQRITLPDIPTPTSWKLAEQYYPTYLDIIQSILIMLQWKERDIKKVLDKHKPSPNVRSDLPDPSFTGPF